MNIPRLTLVPLLWLCLPAYGGDYQSLTQQPKPQQPIPLGVVKNDAHQPITLPDNPQSGLEFASDEYLVSPERTSSAANSHKNNSHKNKSHTSKPHPSKPLTEPKQLLANDPQCRWLNQRIQHLKKQMGSKNHSSKSHYQEELDAREQEFSCMRCANEGPAEGDHHACHYRR